MMPSTTDIERSRNAIVGAIATGDMAAVAAIIGQPGIGVDRSCSISSMLFQVALDLPEIMCQYAEARESLRIVGKPAPDPTATEDALVAALVSLIQFSRAQRIENARLISTCHPAPAGQIPATEATP